MSNECFIFVLLFYVSRKKNDLTKLFFKFVLGKNANSLLLSHLALALRLKEEEILNCKRRPKTAEKIRREERERERERDVMKREER